ncbi:MAG: hypothetical protein QF805_25650, partial [Pirellulaceae bacterium]|nr:hypothetical protein [Pirellulaceae bacterium]
MSADEVLLDVEERMEKAVNVLKDNLAGIRTGRAEQPEPKRASLAGCRPRPSAVQGLLRTPWQRGGPR